MTLMPASPFVTLQKGLLQQLFSRPRQPAVRVLSRPLTGAVELTPHDRREPIDKTGTVRSTYTASHRDHPGHPVQLSVVERPETRDVSLFVHPGSRSPWDIGAHRDLVQHLLAHHPRIASVQVLRPGKTTSPAYDLPTLVDEMTRRSVWTAHLDR